MSFVARERQQRRVKIAPTRFHVSRGVVPEELFEMTGLRCSLCILGTLPTGTVYTNAGWSSFTVVATQRRRVRESDRGLVHTLIAAVDSESTHRWSHLVGARFVDSGDLGNISNISVLCTCHVGQDCILSGPACKRGSPLCAASNSLDAGRENAAERFLRSPLSATILQLKEGRACQ